MSRSIGTRVGGCLVLGSAPLLFIGLALFALPLLPERLNPISSTSSVARVASLAGGGGISILAVALCLVGLALYIFAPAFAGTQRASQGYGSHRVVLACTLFSVILGNALAALYFVPAAVLSPGGLVPAVDRLFSPLGIVVAALALDVVLLGVVYLRVVRPGVITWARMGLARTGVGRRVGLGLLLGVLLLAVSAALEAFMETLGIHQTQSRLFAPIRGASPAEFVLVLLAGAVIAPVVEEIYFRGYIFRAYADQKGLGRAFIFSSLLFALVHLNLPALVPILGMGLLLSLFYHRTGSIVPGIVAHAMNNAFAFALLYLGLQ